MSRRLKMGAGFVVLIAATVALVFTLTAGMVKDSKTFFTALKNNDIAKASSYLSTSFRNATSIEEFKKYFDSSDLAAYKDSSWGSRSIQNDMGELKGSIKTESGQKIPLTINFVKEDGKWKILSIDIKNTGLNATGLDISKPNE